MPDEERPHEPGHVSASRTDAHPPLPRDKRGWQVSPAPDGRGMPEQTPQDREREKRQAGLHDRRPPTGRALRCFRFAAS